MTRGGKKREGRENESDAKRKEGEGKGGEGREKESDETKREGKGK